jgi:hypothetical protein
LKQKIAIALVLLLPFLAKSQDNLGIAGSTRAPANTVLINPSSIVDSRAFIDINLVGASIFASNNFVYMPGSNFSFRDLANTGLPGYNRKHAPYRAFVDAGVHGPSVTFAIKQHAFGLYTGARVGVSAVGIPEGLGYQLTNGFQYQPLLRQPQSVKNLRLGALGWLEAGATYGTVLARSGNLLVQGGVTVKKIWGITGIALNADSWDYTVQDSSNLITGSIKGQFGFNDIIANPPGLQNGKGWGVDVGLTFKYRKSESTEYIPNNPCTDGDYLYRFGVALLDMGSISFNAPFYSAKFATNDSALWAAYNDAQVDGLADVDSLLGRSLGIPPGAATQSYRMMLPGAISFNIDYNLGRNFYLYGMATYGFPWKNRLGVQRGSYVGIAPRYERMRFEAALPITMADFRRPEVGLMLRLNSIIIGTDNIGALLFNGNIYGADFYVSLKWTVFRHKACRGKKEKAGLVRKRSEFDPVPCPSW